MRKGVKGLVTALAICMIVIMLFTPVYGEEAAPTIPAEPIAPTDPGESAEVEHLSAAFSADRAYLTWDAHAAAPGYEIYSDSGSGQVLCGCTPDRTFRTGKLNPATYYTFYVYIYTVEDGERVTCPTAAQISGWTLPEAPSYSISKSGKTYTLKWSAVKGADRYEIMSRLPEESTWTVNAKISGLSGSVTVAYADEVYFGVRAVMKRDNRTYRSDYRKKLYSTIPTTGSMIAFGDSIGKGSGSHFYSYPEMLARTHRLKLKNYSVSGATLGVTPTEHSICSDVLLRVSPALDCSYVLLDGGYNDYSLSVPLGEVTPDGADEFDASTVCGALETIFTRIRTDMPNAEPIFVMVHEVTNSYQKENLLGLTFSDYKTGIFSVCQKYGVPIADCSTQLCTLDIDMRRQYTTLRFGVHPNGDGIHPNEEGYRTFYIPVIEPVLTALETPTQAPTDLPIATPDEAPIQAPTEPPAPTPTVDVEPFLLGDADGDGSLTVLDATIIQRYLAQYPVDDPQGVARRGNITGDELSILDATTIQRYLAEQSCAADIGQPVVYAARSH